MNNLKRFSTIKKLEQLGLLFMGKKGDSSKAAQPPLTSDISFSSETPKESHLILVPVTDQSDTVSLAEMEPLLHTTTTSTRTVFKFSPDQQYPPSPDLYDSKVYFVKEPTASVPILSAPYPTVALVRSFLQDVFEDD